MHEALQGLEPEVVWKYFDSIRQIPRCSKHEERIVDYVLGVADQLGIESGKDDVGNVVIRKPASPGYENHASMCLQGHLDMVCEKNTDVDFDFSKDAIELRREGDYIMADGTTLGADNGIGIAIALALASAQELKHPPLELLFTVDEETGLTGASKLTSEFLKSRRMINVDSEELGTIYIGCAGGGDTAIRFPLGDTEPVEGLSTVHVQVKGLKGGHSGVDIHLGRGNAIKCLARALYSVASEQSIRLVSISGGNKRNAIPREAEATVLMEDPEKASDILKRTERELSIEYEGIEEGIAIAQDIIEHGVAYSQKSSMDLISLLLALPHGYLAFNPHISGLVDTSSNLATVNMKGKHVEIGCNTRSSMNSAIESVRDKIVATSNLAGAEAEKSGSYPSWKPNMNSELLVVARQVYSDEFGEEPEIKAIHAGLETGIIGDNFEGMDMISIGPTIEFPHSPDERLGISSVSSFWKYLTSLLAKL
jgi:dipeptidase D